MLLKIEFSQYSDILENFSLDIEILIHYYLFFVIIYCSAKNDNCISYMKPTGCVFIC